MAEVKILGDIVITPLIKAFKTFKEGVEQAETRLEKDGAIQRFEYCYELSWKVLKKVLEYKGVSTRNPRDTFREAAYQGIISNPEIWFSLVEKRNLTVHTYKEEVAIEVDNVLPMAIKEVEALIQSLTSLS